MIFPGANILVVDAQTLQRVQGRSDPRPMVTEVFFLLLFPIRHHLGAEVGYLIEIRFAEVQQERRGNDTHFDNEEHVVKVDQARNLKPVDFRDSP